MRVAVDSTVKALRHPSQMHIFRKSLAKSYLREHSRPNKQYILIYTRMAQELYWEIYLGFIAN